MTEAQTDAETKEIDITASRLAAGAVAEAFQLDYFREYAANSLKKPSGNDRAGAWHRAEKNFPQFTERIAELGATIPNAQLTRELLDYQLKGVYAEIVNPLAREFLINIVMAKFGSGTSAYGARDQFLQRGEGELKKAIDGLGENGFDPSSLTPTDVAQAYLLGHL